MSDLSLLDFLRDDEPAEVQNLPSKVFDGFSEKQGSLRLSKSKGPGRPTISSKSVPTFLNLVVNDPIVQVEESFGKLSESEQVKMFFDETSGKHFEFMLNRYQVQSPNSLVLKNGRGTWPSQNNLPFLCELFHKLQIDGDVSLCLYLFFLWIEKLDEPRRSVTRKLLKQYTNSTKVTSRLLTPLLKFTSKKVNPPTNNVSKVSPSDQISLQGEDQQSVIPLSEYEERMIEICIFGVHYKLLNFIFKKKASSQKSFLRTIIDKDQLKKFPVQEYVKQLPSAGRASTLYAILKRLEGLSMAQFFEVEYLFQINPKTKTIPFQLPLLDQNKKTSLVTQFIGPILYSCCKFEMIDSLSLPQVSSSAVSSSSSPSSSPSSSSSSSSPSPSSSSLSPSPSSSTSSSLSLSPASSSSDSTSILSAVPSPDSASTTSLTGTNGGGFGSARTRFSRGHRLSANFTSAAAILSHQRIPPASPPPLSVSTTSSPSLPNEINKEPLSQCFSLVLPPVEPDISAPAASSSSSSSSSSGAPPSSSGFLNLTSPSLKSFSAFPNKSGHKSHNNGRKELKRINMSLVSHILVGLFQEFHETIENFPCLSFSDINHVLIFSKLSTPNLKHVVLPSYCSQHYYFANSSVTTNNPNNIQNNNLSNNGHHKMMVPESEMGEFLLRCAQFLNCKNASIETLDLRHFSSQHLEQLLSILSVNSCHNNKKHENNVQQNSNIHKQNLKFPHLIELSLNSFRSEPSTRQSSPSEVASLSSLSVSLPGSSPSSPLGPSPLSVSPITSPRRTSVSPSVRSSSPPITRRDAASSSSPPSSPRGSPPISPGTVAPRASRHTIHPTTVSPLSGSLGSSPSSSLLLSPKFFDFRKVTISRKNKTRESGSPATSNNAQKQQQSQQPAQEKKNLSVSIQAPQDAEQEKHNNHNNANNITDTTVGEKSDTDFRYAEEINKFVTLQILTMKLETSDETIYLFSSLNLPNLIQFKVNAVVSKRNLLNHFINRNTQLKTLNLSSSKLLFSRILDLAFQSSHSIKNNCDTQQGSNTDDEGETLSISSIPSSPISPSLVTNSSNDNLSANNGNDSNTENENTSEKRAKKHRNDGQRNVDENESETERNGLSSFSQPPMSILTSSEKSFCEIQKEKIKKRNSLAPAIKVTTSSPSTATSSTEQKKKKKVEMEIDELNCRAQELKIIFSLENVYPSTIVSTIDTHLSKLNSFLGEKNIVITIGSG